MITSTTFINYTQEDKINYIYNSTLPDTQICPNYKYIHCKIKFKNNIQVDFKFETVSDPNFSYVSKKRIMCDNVLLYNSLNDINNNDLVDFYDTNSNSIYYKDIDFKLITHEELYDL